MKITGYPVEEGWAEGEVVVSPKPITFYGGVDPATSEIVEPGHPLQGVALKGKILIFPHSKGSTVGSYIILRMAKRGTAPAAIITVKPDEVVIVGCIIGHVPSMTRIDEVVLSRVKTGSRGILHVGKEYAELLLE